MLKPFMPSSGAVPRIIAGQRLTTGMIFAADDEASFQDARVIASFPAHFFRELII
jgi:hypothetical protein